MIKSTVKINSADKRLSVAPMMDYTDRHARFLMRLISNNIILYTEMIHANAILHSDNHNLLSYHPSEQPLVLQLGGSVPADLAKAAKIGEELGYAEINLNVGCPSGRVSAGGFGACLIKQPELVADCYQAIAQAVNIPVTIKTRTGVDEFDSYDYFQTFIETIIGAGCEIVIVHARKAWLKGLSPKQNRMIPPLNYDTVYRIKRDFPDKTFVINGGINHAASVKQHLMQVDGVMIGRSAYQNLWLLNQLQSEFYTKTTTSRLMVFEQYLHYCQQALADGVHLPSLMKPLYGLMFQVPGTKKWRQYIHRATSDPKLLFDNGSHAMQYVDLLSQAG